MRQSFFVFIPGMFRVLLIAFLFIVSANDSEAVERENVLVLGDSLSDEYAFLAFSESTNPDWRARNWVEILAAERTEDVHFGEYRDEEWDLFRREGYAFNWAVPGMTAGQLRTLLSDPNLAVEREVLEDQIESQVTRAVVVIGVNDFYDAYSLIYGGGDGGALGDRVIKDIEFIINYLRSFNDQLEIALANIPDPGATPRVVERYPDPAGRKRVEGAIRETNDRIEAMVAEKGLALVDIFSVSIRLIEGAPFLVDGLEILERGHPDNHPNFLFTHDEFHPGTVAHAVYANQVINAFNRKWRDGIEPMRETEILALAGLPVAEAYEEWIGHFEVEDGAFEAAPGGDGIPNAVKYVLGLNPERNENGRFPRAETVYDQNNGLALQVTYRHRRDDNGRFLLKPWYSENFVEWSAVPDEHEEIDENGAVTATIPLHNGRGFVRFQVTVDEP